MNKKAEELGLKNTHFVTPHGLDDPNHYTTAYELAILTDYALQNEKFAKIVSTKTKVILINGRQTEIYNTNELLGNLNGINGVKTGFTNNAGRCLVCSCIRNNMNIISVVLGADTKKFRTKDSIEIIEYAYKNYEMINIKEEIEHAFENWRKNYKTKIYKGEKQSLNVELEEIPYNNYPIKIEDKDNISFEFTEENYFEAPVEQGRNIGKLSVKLKDKEICSLNIFTKEEVLKKTVWQYLEEMMEKIKLIEKY